MRIDALDDLAIELHDQPEDSVRRRVLRPEVDRVVGDALVAGVARVAEVGTLADGADADFDFAWLLGLDPRVVQPSEEISAIVGHGSFLRDGLLTSLLALAERGLRASLVACLSPGAPPPVWAGVSVVFASLAGVFGFSLEGAFGAGAGDGAPAASAVAFSSPGNRYSGPSHGIRKSKLRKSCGSDTGS